VTDGAGLLYDWLKETLRPAAPAVDYRGYQPTAGEVI